MIIGPTEITKNIFFKTTAKRKPCWRAWRRAAGLISQSASRAGARRLIGAGDSVLLASRQHTARARPQVPGRHQHDQHRLVPRVAAGGAHLRQPTIPRRNRPARGLCDRPSCSRLSEPCALKTWGPAEAPDLGNMFRFWGLIYSISFHFLTIMPKLRSTYDGRLIYQTSYEERKMVQFTCKIVRSSEMCS